ncbi:SGNH/GDSL hydrolase family protein [Niabella drilacis]|uniref:Lysophospholipase L1 n=1 Tax=Niabella drilacis (strain DSM 25811 / CCM 8410 / CCUG 62505 / LMG 26954 / E90) TaxID=1285928 RepID=A0A1G6U552_NIADE|nr:SGNH/GDSL hydrolase family protein [Niabella drilacis]SDD36411.1 Lysophospholipase L1 [Niabella drilacis]
MMVKKTALLLPLVLLMLAFQPVKKKKVIFFGDSITQQGAGPGGYIMRIDSMSKAAHLADQFEFVGKGIGGNKVYDLFLRFQPDVLDQKPDIVLVYVGINDVWHKAMGTGTDFDKFGKFYDAIISTLKKQGIQPVVCTPSVIGEWNDGTNQQDGDLNLYAKWIREYAAKNGVPLVDLRKIFLDYLQQNNPENKDRGILTVDRVHLNEKGNQLVADAMWKVIRSLK